MVRSVRSSALRSLVLIALVGLCSWHLQAQVVFYTDEGLFEVSFPGLDVEDFEAGIGGLSSVECPNPVAASYPFPTDFCFPPDSLLPRVVIASLGEFFFEGMRLWSAGGQIPSQTVSVADPNPGQGLILYLPGGAPAVGFEVFVDAPGPLPVTVSVFGADNTLLDSTAAEGSDAGIFLGISSSQDIYRVEIHSDSRVEGVDNVQFDAGFIFDDGFEGGDLSVWLCDDYDGDGTTACGGDCDDFDPMIPGSFDLCGDGRDNDCSGGVDDTCCDPLAQECPGADACFPIFNIAPEYPPQTACIGIAAGAGGQGEVCPFINSCFEGYACALVDLMNPGNLLCAYMCDADDGVPGCQDPQGPGGGFVCARLNEFYFDIASEDSWGMCIPEDLTCGDAFCQPWESVQTCPVDCN